MKEKEGGVRREERERERERERKRALVLSVRDRSSSAANQSRSVAILSSTVLCFSPPQRSSLSLSQILTDGRGGDRHDW
jgi:hypothetical protein